MDIFSHGFWAVASAKAANKLNKNKKRKPFNLWLAGLWGVFPDIFAFTLPFGWLFLNLISGDSIGFPGRPSTLEPTEDPKLLFGDGNLETETIFLFRITALLYSISHSAIVFVGIFLLVWLIKRRIVWEVGGWLFHVILDIPTHSCVFYPTPFLWPISNYTFCGFRWGNPWFLIPEYIAIIFVYVFFLRKKRSAKIINNV